MDFWLWIHLLDWWPHGSSCSRIYTSPARIEPAKGCRDQYEAWSNQPTSAWQSREVDDGRAHHTIGRKTAPGAHQELDATLHASNSFGTAELLWLVDMDLCGPINLCNSSCECNLKLSILYFYIHVLGVYYLSLQCGIIRPCNMCMFCHFVCTDPSNISCCTLKL